MYFSNFFVVVTDRNYMNLSHKARMKKKNLSYFDLKSLLAGSWHRSLSFCSNEAKFRIHSAVKFIYFVAFSKHTNFMTWGQ